MTSNLTWLHVHSLALTQRMRFRSYRAAALAVIAMTIVPTMTALASSASARPATRSERSGLLAAYRANDGSTAGVRGVFVSRSNSSLGVVCVRTPEADTKAFVFGRGHGSWRYLTSGSPGRAGNAADRSLERAC